MARAASPAERINRSMSRRRHFLAVCALLLALAILGKLVHIQLFQGAALAAQGEALRTVSVEVAAPRGTITDRNGELFATSVDRYNVVVDQVGLADYKYVTEDGDLLTGAIAAAKRLSPILQIDEPILAAQLAGERRFVYLLKNITPEQWREIADLRVSGISGERTSQRTYPAGTTAGSLVGWVGADGTPLGGLELALDERLSGTPGLRVYERGLRGQQIPAADASQVEPVPGEDVTLTIDRDLQWKAQQLADDVMRQTGASRVSIVIQDVESFELLALADSGAMDPQDPTGVPQARRASQSVTEIFEPGSTTKVITMATAIELGLTTPDEQFVVKDTIKMPNNESFRDALPHPAQQLTTAGIVATSSNTGTITIGQRIPVQTYHDFLVKFGIGQSANLGLPGETRGLLIDDPNRWDGRTRYAVLFGQGLAVNAVQNVSVFSTIANGGVRLPVTLVRSDEPLEGVEVVSEDTAQQVLDMLEGAVESDGGTGRQAQVPGYRIAGKTGTAQAADSDGKMTRHVASFVGVVSGEKPEVTIAVTVVDPKTSIYGSTVAAPVFSEMAEFTVQHLGIPPVEDAKPRYATSWGDEAG